MIPDFAGQKISRIRIDYRLQLWTDAGWQFNLEGDTQLVRRREQPAPISISGQCEGEDVPEALQELVGQQLQGVAVSANGDLGLNFPNAQLSTLASEHFESWQIHGPDGEMAVCMPGGELAVWGPRI